MEFDSLEALCDLIFFFLILKMVDNLVGGKISSMDSLSIVHKN